MSVRNWKQKWPRQYFWTFLLRTLTVWNVSECTGTRELFFSDLLAAWSRKKGLKLILPFATSTCKVLESQFWKWFSVQGPSHGWMKHTFSGNKLSKTHLGKYILIQSSELGSSLGRVIAEFAFTGQILSFLSYMKFFVWKNILSKTNFQKHI